MTATPLTYPAATWKPVPSHGGAMIEQRGLVEHITTNDFSPYGFFTNPANQASSDLWIAADGAVEQYVDLRMRAWAQAAGNGTWNSVEVSGQTGTLKTAAQCEAFAHLLAWGHQHPELRWPLNPSDSPDVHGVGWHGMGAAVGWGHPYCPGDQRVAQTRQVVIPRALELVGGPPTPITEETDMARLISEDGHKIFGSDGARVWHVPTPAALKAMVATGVYGDGKVWPVPAGTVASLLAAEK